MKNDANVTHQENEMHRMSATEVALDDRGPGVGNVASVNKETAGKEALRSMALNETDKRKLTDLETGDESDPGDKARIPRENPWA
ncbi:hypothetical protein [Paenibacillus sp.]|uniref:hypothetical protein n=1 Tax=Paenibacillus sp. TaxID=58172 RepID=UPI002D2ED155|nr:hypothetical protein [Paenibacillus sp.]HZG56870.1 hypothetical protein [Paenibacillus sp.]